MLIKAIEIRDKHTFIPAIAVKMFKQNAAQDYLLRRAGLGSAGSFSIFLIDLNRGAGFIDPHQWGSRTMRNAHGWLEEHFDEIHDGHVVDVEYILGEVEQPKTSEAFDTP
jgi:hypothetical protein